MSLDYREIVCDQVGVGGWGVSVVDDGEIACDQIGVGG